MTVIRLFDGPRTLQVLTQDTMSLIHATYEAAAIKRLMNMHDILDLNLTIQNSFKYNPPWDFAAMKELGILRRELVVYHRGDFHPTVLLDEYSTKLNRLLNLLVQSYSLKWNPA